RAEPFGLVAQPVLPILRVVRRLGHVDAPARRPRVETEIVPLLRRQAFRYGVSCLIFEGCYSGQDPPRAQAGDAALAPCGEQLLPVRKEPEADAVATIVPVHFEAQDVLLSLRVEKPDALVVNLAQHHAIAGRDEIDTVT